MTDLDIVARLRFQAGGRNILPDHDLMLAAADEIERLRVELARRTEEFDRVGYQREYMRKWRAARKAKGA